LRKRSKRKKKRDKEKEKKGRAPIPGIGDEVGLELGEVHIEGPIKPQGGRDGGHYLACTKIMR
jgi:hypothetical protein